MECFFLYLWSAFLILGLNALSSTLHESACIVIYPVLSKACAQTWDTICNLLLVRAEPSVMSSVKELQYWGRSLSRRLLLPRLHLQQTELARTNTFYLECCIFEVLKCHPTLDQSAPVPKDLPKHLKSAVGLFSWLMQILTGLLSLEMEMGHKEIGYTPLDCTTSFPYQDSASCQPFKWI